jgi:SAM-dependent methyltransferase
MNYRGTGIGPLEKAMGRVLSWFGPLKERVELSVMNLQGREEGVLLDIGCGTGGFLARMRDLGWEVVGIEPDGQAAEWARRNYGFDVMQGTPERIDLPDQSVDAITMNHVVEHLHDPLATLAECSRLLKPDGRLVVVTPNVESLGNRIFKNSCLNLDPPRHLYLFSPDTLKACAERAGLRVIGLRTLTRTASHVLVSSSLIRRDGRLPGGFPRDPGLGLRLKGRMFQALERGLCRFSSVGEEILLIGTRTGSRCQRGVYH